MHQIKYLSSEFKATPATCTTKMKLDGLYFNYLHF